MGYAFRSPMRTHRLIPSALPSRDFDALRQALLESPLVGRSTLAGPFQTSRGFAVIFRREGVSKVTARFPTLAPWLDRVLGQASVDALTPWFRRRRPAPNAWYLNVLLVSEGGTVERHVDATLRKLSGDDHALPQVVSVLYLSVPPVPGGELLLWPSAMVPTRIAPKENTGLHFRGDLAHQVAPFEGAPGSLRASLVIEQYHLEPTPLAQLPEFKLESRAGFDAFLAHHAGAGSQP